MVEVGHIRSQRRHAEMLGASVSVAMRALERHRELSAKVATMSKTSMIHSDIPSSQRRMDS